MHKFVFGCDSDYNYLKEKLNDNLCTRYQNCILPSSFANRFCNIGFEKFKDNKSYVLLIDYGLTCSKASRIPLLKIWLEKGELKFLDFNDMKTFFKEPSMLVLRRITYEFNKCDNYIYCHYRRDLYIYKSRQKQCPRAAQNAKSQYKSSNYRKYDD